MKPAVFILLLLTACAGSKEYSDRKLPPPPHLPETARALLSEQMLDHGRDMSDLLWATLFLDDESVRDIADHIRSAPRLARPQTRDASELNSQLPAEFFDLQDELVRRATELADVAESRDPQLMAARYGELAETCVRCHMMYLSQPPEPLTQTELEP